MKVNVEVTQEDIDKGIREDSCECPIARALKRFGYRSVDVEDDCAGFYVKNADKSGMCTSYLFYLPKKAIKFVSKFDNGEQVAPINFVLRKQVL